MGSITEIIAESLSLLRRNLSLFLSTAILFGIIDYLFGMLAIKFHIAVQDLDIELDLTSEEAEQFPSYFDYAEGLLTTLITLIPFFIFFIILNTLFLLRSQQQTALPNFAALIQEKFWPVLKGFFFLVILYMWPFLIALLVGKILQPKDEHYPLLELGVVVPLLVATVLSFWFFLKYFFIPFFYLFHNDMDFSKARIGSAQLMKGRKSKFIFLLLISGIPLFLVYWFSVSSGASPTYLVTGTEPSDSLRVTMFFQSILASITWLPIQAAIFLFFKRGTGI